MPGFRRPVTIRFEEADARGVLFYGRLQALAHHVWEDFVVSELVDRWEDWFESRSSSRRSSTRKPPTIARSGPATTTWRS